MDLPVDDMEDGSDDSGIEGEEGIERNSNGTEVPGREGRSKGSWEDTPAGFGMVEGVMAKVRSANMLGETAKLEVGSVFQKGLQQIVFYHFPHLQ